MLFNETERSFELKRFKQVKDDLDVKVFAMCTIITIGTDSICPCVI